MDHARARDAVHAALDTHTLASALHTAGFSTQHIRSRAATRAEYLRRPDYGRALHPESVALLQALAATPEPDPRQPRLTIVIADGLSALAPARHSLPLLEALRARLLCSSTKLEARWQIDTIVLATQARVALADQVGFLRQATAVAIFIGERPGLSSPDSLGIYMTLNPRPGRLDSERNCISNIRHAGLSYPEAAYKLHYLLEQSRHQGLSGVSVKDDSAWDQNNPNGALHAGSNHKELSP
jgi:ethanolamine ammonia-lyase small subunit